MADRQTTQNIYELIDAVMQDDKLKSGKIYHDEPILRPASQIPRPAASKNDIPERIREMKRLAYSEEMMWKPREYIFYRQGKLMEDYEDTYICRGGVEIFFPTYASMTTEQLRGYFTWRASVRRGKVPQSGRSYIFIYLYELLNGIGTSSPEDGLEKLKKARELFGGDDTVTRYLDKWTRDYIIYNTLPVETDGDYEEAMSVLLGWREKSDDELFAAVRRISGYDTDRSEFCSVYPDDFREVVCTAYRGLAAYCETHNKKTLFEKLFGRRVQSMYEMFRGAVFWERMPERSLEYVVSDFCRYELHRGIWYSDMYVYDRNYNKQLRGFVRTVEHIMREKYGFKQMSGGITATKTETKITENAVDALAERKKREEASRIEIDISKLGSIRQASEMTRDKLIVEEPAPEEPEITDIPRQEVMQAVENETPLNDAEYRFMQCLLYGGDAVETARNAGTMPSLLADSVNEKLFDIFGDTVLELSGGVPEVIEDYTEELKGLISE